MPNLSRNFVRTTALALIGAAAVTGAVVARTSPAAALDRTPYEQCLYDSILYCRDTYPTGPDRIQCMWDGREACDRAHGMG